MSSDPAMDYLAKLKVRIRECLDVAVAGKADEKALLVQEISERLDVFGAWAKSVGLTTREAARVQIALILKFWNRSGKMDRLEDTDPEMFDVLMRSSELYGPDQLSARERQLLVQYEAAVTGEAASA